MRLIALLLLALCQSAFAAPDKEAEVSISQAQICFLNQCYPALIGQHTSPGVFPIMHARVNAPGYGGDVLVFATRIDGVPLAIHRVWLLKPEQRRLERLKGSVAARKGITGGCINVMPEVYQKLVDCCSKGQLTIEP